MKTAAHSALLIGIVVTIISSCRVTSKSACGLYVFIDKHNSEFSEALHLKPDSSFNFEISNAMVPYPPLSGIWSVKNHRVYLTATTISVQPGPMGGDTLKFNNWFYEVKPNKLKRLTKSGKYRVLKKLKGNPKSVKLNGIPF